MAPLAALAAAAASGAMPYVTLNTGARMPQLLLGTWRYDNDTVEAEINTAFGDPGFRGVLAAEQYRNQWGVGKGLHTQMSERGANLRREDIFVATMTLPRPGVGGCGPGGLSAEACFNATLLDVEFDLAALGLEYVDLIILHMPNTGLGRGCDEESCEKDLAQWRAYEQVYKAGKAKAIGVSNYCQGCLECLLNHSDVVPAVNQLQYHIGMGEDPEGLHSFCAAHNIAIQAYSPLATGSLVKYPVAASIGAAHNKTGPQVALKWVMDQGKAMATEATTMEYLMQDVDMFSWNLTAEETRNLTDTRCPIEWDGGRVDVQQCYSSFTCPARNMTPAESALWAAP